MGVMHVCVRAYVGRSFSVRVFFLFGCLVVCFFFFFVFVACLAGVAVGSKRVANHKTASTAFVLRGRVRRFTCSSFNSSISMGNRSELFTHQKSTSEVLSLTPPTHPCSGVRWSSSLSPAHHVGRWTDWWVEGMSSVVSDDAP